MDVLTSYELIGLIITAATAVITFLKSSDDLKEQNAAMAAVIGIALTVVLGMRFDTIPKLQGQLSGADVIRKNTTRHKLLESAVASGYLTVDDNEFVALPLKDRLNSLQQQFEQIAAGRFSVSESEMPVFNVRMIESARKSVEATNYIGLSRWWEQAWGEQYERANEAAIKRGITITRVFIFAGGNEMSVAKTIMTLEANSGIHVRYALQADLPPFTGDVVLVDGTLEGQHQIVPGKGISEAVFSANPSDIKEAEFSFQNIETNSREFRP